MKNIVLQLRTYFSFKLNEEGVPEQPTEASVRSANALILSLVILLFVIAGAIAAFVEGANPLLLTQIVVAGASVFGIFWTRRSGDGKPALLTICGALIFLCLFIVLSPNTNRSHLLWFLLFPPMMMYCGGLRYGTLLFAALFLFLLLGFTGVIPSRVLQDFPPAWAWRFCAVLAGSALFAWLSEYVRFKNLRGLRQALARLEQDALTDQLTGLGNRRDFYNFFSWLQAKQQRRQDADKSIAIAILDIDRFKSVNDRFGHDAGDKVLQHVATILNGQLRQGDRLFRWGGEEFIALLAETPCEYMPGIMERMRHRLETSPCQYKDLTIPCTISIGLFCTYASPDLKDMVTAADALLYAAKEGGRNQVRSTIDQTGPAG